MRPPRTVLGRADGKAAANVAGSAGKLARLLTSSRQTGAVGYFLKNPTVNGTRRVITRRGKAHLAATLYRLKNPTAKGWKRYCLNSGTLHIHPTVTRGARPIFLRGSNGNKGAIVGTATYSGTNTAIPAGSLGVMLLPMQINSKDRMIEGSVNLPASWTGISLHFINTTTGQDLGTFNNVVENMTAATPAFKIYSDEAAIYSDTEMQQDQAGSLDPLATSQKVTFFKDDNNPTLLHFATTFDAVGTVQVQIIKNGSVMGYGAVTLTADSDFSSLISEVDTRISNPFPTPVVDPTDPNSTGAPSDGLGLLIAEEPGSLASPGAIDPNKSDPSQLVLPLHSGTALPAATDHDLSLVTLRRPTGLTTNAGTVTLTVSAPSSVTLFNSAATHVLANYSVNLAAPAGDLAALASGNAQVWVRGAAANSDVTLTYTYTDANGVVQQTDTVQLSVSTSGAMIWPGSMRDMPLFCGSGGIRGPPGVAMSLMSMKVWSSVGQTAPIPPSAINNNALTTKSLLKVLEVVVTGSPDPVSYYRGVLEGIGAGAWSDLHLLGQAAFASTTPGQIYYAQETFATAYNIGTALGALAKETPAQRQQLLDNLLISAGIQAAGAYISWQSLTSDQQETDVEYCRGYLSGYIVEQVVVLKGLGVAAEAVKTQLTAFEAGSAVLTEASTLRTVDTVLADTLETVPSSIPASDVPAAREAIEEAAVTPNGSTTEGDVINTNINSLNASSGAPFSQEFSQAMADAIAKREQAGYASPWPTLGKKAVVHLGDLISQLGVGAGHWAFQGYEKFCPGIIDFIGNDYFPNLITAFTDSGTLNTADLKAVLEQLSDGPNNYLTRSSTDYTQWTSSTSGLVYGPAPAGSDGHRIIHVLMHMVADPSDPGHSIFGGTVTRQNLFAKLDEAWSKRLVKGADPEDAFRFEIEMTDSVGQNGETKIALIVNPQTQQVITAYPIAAFTY